MFLILSPAPELVPFVNSYWFIEDIPGTYAGLPISTSPLPMAVLSINLGRPNATEDGTLVPNVSLLGLQSNARLWQSWSNTYFVMAMLTVPGIIRLFPHSGQDSANRLLDLGAIIGDAGSVSLSSGVTAALEPRCIAAELDQWLIARLASCAPVQESKSLVAAYNILRLGGSVAKAAEAVNVDRRQLQRWSHKHIGMRPKELADLERLNRSLKAVQTGQGDPITGFSDQAHQIRNWRRRLGITPGCYGKKASSSFASHFSSNDKWVKPAFYL